MMKYLLLVFCFFLPTTNCYPQDIQPKGQAALLFQHSDDGSIGEFLFLPGCSVDYHFSGGQVLNGEVYLHGTAQTDFRENSFDPKLYRAILRYTSEQSEIQLGLQKINFGPAQLLRALMWFDSVDPRDPMKLTDGVYGLRYKYGFLNNANVWLWGLLGNGTPKGMELAGSEKKQPEFGGRLQFPFMGGELGSTLHTRTVKNGMLSYRENKFALDGRWDVEVGAWCEIVCQENERSDLPYRWINYETIGLDYTLPVGNGVYVLLEGMNIGQSGQFGGQDLNRQLSAAMITYQLSMMDSFSAIGYYDFNGKNFYQYYQLQRTYDSFSLVGSVFHYPLSLNNGILQGANTMIGIGFQLLLVFNF